MMRSFKMNHYRSGEVLKTITNLASFSVENRVLLSVVTFCKFYSPLAKNYMYVYELEIFNNYLLMVR